MANVAYILTRSVKHLAAWSQDGPQHQTDRWATGRPRPICGAKVPDNWKDTVWRTATEPADEVARADRLPVCKHCERTLAMLVELAGVSGNR